MDTDNYISGGGSYHERIIVALLCRIDILEQQVERLTPREVPPLKELAGMLREQHPDLGLTELVNMGVTMYPTINPGSLRTTVYKLLGEGG